MGISGRAGFTHESITVSSSSVGLTEATYSPGTQVPPTRGAIITVEDQNIRFRIDGTAPTSSVGHLAKNDDTITLGSIDDVTNFRAIRQSGVDATIRVSYKR